MPAFNLSQIHRTFFVQTQGGSRVVNDTERLKKAIGQYYREESDKEAKEIQAKIEANSEARDEVLEKIKAAKDSTAQSQLQGELKSLKEIGEQLTQSKKSLNQEMNGKIIDLKSKSSDELEQLKVELSIQDQDGHKDNNNQKEGHQSIFTDEQRRKWDSFVKQHPDITKEAQEHFNKLSHGAQKDQDFAAYLKCYQTCLFVAEVIENNNDGTEVAGRAFAMFTMFGGDLALAQKFLDAHYANNQNPMHDMLLSNVPEGIDLEGWRKLIKEDAGKTDIVKSFANAKELELSGKAPANVMEFSSRLDLLFKTTEQYGAFDPKYMDFAKICARYKVDASTFNKCLDLMKDGKPLAQIKESDLIPDVVVDIGKIEGLSEKAGHYLVKLPAGDLRGLILGKITDCCQSMNGNSEKCVIDGMTLQNNAFYVLVKAKGEKFDPKNIDWKNFEANGHKIEGQGYIWRSLSGSTLTFDSWENLQNESNDAMMLKVLQQFGQQVCALGGSGVERLTIGEGGKTPVDIINTKTGKVYSEEMKEGYSYGDSSKQIELYVSDNLVQQRKNVAKKIGVKTKQYQITSVAHAEFIKKQLEAGNDFTTALKNKYSYFFRPEIFYSCEKYNLIDVIGQLKDETKITSLTSKNASKIYQECNIGPKDLIVFDTDQIRAMTLDGAWKIYPKFHLTPNYFKNFDYWKIEALTSSDAMSVYEEFHLSPDYFKDFDSMKIGLLTSDWAMSVYEEFHLSPDYFKGFDAKKIGAMIHSSNAMSVYKEFNLSPDYFKAFDAKKIELLTSSDAMRVYKKFGLNPDYFKDFDVEKIEVLTSSEEVMEVYKKFGLNPDYFKDFDVEKIEALTSEEAMEVYKNFRLSPVDFFSKEEVADEIAQVILADKKPFFEELELHAKDFGEKKEAIIKYANNHVAGAHPLAKRNHDFFIELCKKADPKAGDPDADWAETMWQNEIANKTGDAAKTSLADHVEDMLFKYIQGHNGSLDGL